ncbi:SAM-dependent methyltransferase [Bradyrhizobium sp. YCK136]|uniref:SAM-dependent methyltransferase n=1 Tax=Bradyrhizobium TaxID=374 RepID=UPI001B8AE939|nr:SAM-dependent methyltransferase [Bradyrhizobium diazoefficiens]MBR0861210.1 SAM-dependent methyltransferase [Bradyrhizobium diazoefficiens]MBR0890306.1 SAM-dependent methyltransferase [Bradyrhizobium diazoefficiens]MBR0922080.1 SAM-dependent methyltransferase [Bradyrhizobium diazoefficiens]
MAQNRSHAVMAQRTEAKDSRDDFPTPPWATRALMEHVISDCGPFSSQCALEPACGEGHMAKVLSEYFGEVRASDAFAYGYGDVRDYLEVPHEANAVDWVITNPPFRLAEEFVHRSLVVARRGVAVLARTVFIESVGRYRHLFEKSPPGRVAQFAERVPMVKGRLDRKASTATGYCWLIWLCHEQGPTPRLLWIPPCRRLLERDADYPV